MLDNEMAKTVSIMLRLSPEEHAAWLAAAEVEQMPLSAWIRRRCNGLAATAPETPTPRAAKAPKRKRAR